MRDFLLSLHFLGLTIGAGTGVYLAALARWTAKHRGPPAVRDIMLGPGKAISDVGTIGLLLLIATGVALVFGAGGFGAMPAAFWIKLALVALIVVFVGTMRALAVRARNESGPGTMLLMKKLGPLGLVLAVLTVGAAVAAFH
jgi:hypothetical protein